jgi:hypothetical protein
MHGVSELTAHWISFLGLTVLRRFVVLSCALCLPQQMGAEGALTHTGSTR